MMWIDTILEDLDGYFTTKKKSEKWMIIIGIAAIVLYTSYTYFTPKTRVLYAQSIQKKNEIQKDIAHYKKYLVSIVVDENNRYEKKFNLKVEKQKEDLLQVNKKAIVINRNLEKLSDTLFNKVSWSNFLNSITNKAKIQNVDIQYISNKYIDNNGTFGEVLKIAVGCNGEYKNIVKFMNELERSILITDIYKSKLTLDDKTQSINADINISVWGMK